MASEKRRAAAIPMAGDKRHAGFVFLKPSKMIFLSEKTQGHSIPSSGRLARWLALALAGWLWLAGPGWLALGGGLWFDWPWSGWLAIRRAPSDGAKSDALHGAR